MGINFSELPKDNPFSVPKPGLYLATIKKAEAFQPKDTSKPEYLAVTYEVVSAEGKKCGNVFDNFFESDSDVVKFKLGRFVSALKLPIVGEMTFKDFAKVLPGRTLVIDIKNVPDDYRGNGAMKAEVDLFAREAYYPTEEFESLTGVAPAEPTEEQAETAAPVEANY